MLPTKKEKKGRSPFFCFLSALYIICFAAVFILLITLLLQEDSEKNKDDLPASNQPISPYPIAPTEETTHPAWYPSDTLSPVFSPNCMESQPQLIPDCCLNIPLPAWATYADPLNGRFLLLTSKNFGGYSYIPDTFSFSTTVLMDMNNANILGLEQTIASTPPLSIDKTEIQERIDIIDFKKSDRFCLFRIYTLQNPTADDSQSIPSESKVGIFDIEKKSIRFTPTLDQFDFTLEAASDDFIHLIIRLSSEEGGKILWINTADQSQRDISSYNGTTFPSSAISFSPSGRYILNRFTKTNGQEADWLLIDTQSGRTTAGKGVVRRFLKNDTQMLVWDGEVPLIFTLPNGEKTIPQNTNHPDYYFLQVENGTAALVSCDGTNIFPLFENVQNYIVWQDLLFLYQTDSRHIICYHLQENRFFRVAIENFLDTVENYEITRFDFFIANQGKNILLRVTFPEQSTLHPDLETPFIDDAYQLQPIIETVGMKAFTTYENNVYEKYSVSRRNAKPPLYDFIKGLEISRTELESGAYSETVLDCIYAENEEEMLMGLCSPYALYANGKVMLYNDVLKMDETKIKNANLPLSVYQTYFKTIYTVFIRYDSPETAASFLEKTQKFEDVYAAAFA